MGQAWTSARNCGLAPPLAVKGRVAAIAAQHLVSTWARNAFRPQPRGDQTEAPVSGLTAGPVTGGGDPAPLRVAPVATEITDMEAAGATTPATTHTS